MMQAGLQVQALHKSFGPQRILDDISFSLPAGHRIVVMGPTGTGKSTLLRLLAGLERPDQGDIAWNHQSWNKLPPHRRGVAMVMQQHPLLPHLSVWNNIVFGIRWWMDSKQPKAERLEQIKTLCQQLKITNLLDRKPSTLSGGQIQQVALAHALARQPQLLLLDEPLAHLDPHARQHWRTEIDRPELWKDAASIWVTHDAEQALSLANAQNSRLAVLHQGKFQQIGPAEQLFEHPAHPVVAQLLSHPTINAWSVEIMDDQGRMKVKSLDSPDKPIDLPPPLGRRLKAGFYTFYTRPQHWKINQPVDDDWNLPANCQRVEKIGVYTQCWMQTPLGNLSILLTDQTQQEELFDKPVTVSIHADRVLIFPRDEN